jgi:hypothetical protein
VLLAENMILVKAAHRAESFCGQKVKYPEMKKINTWEMAVLVCGIN